MDGRLLFRVALVVCVAALALVGVASGQETQPPVRACGTVAYTDMTVELKVRGRASCRGARRVARLYEDKAAEGEGCPPEGGNTCPLRIGSFRCRAPTAASLPLVLSCSSRRLEARIKGYKVEPDD